MEYNKPDVVITSGASAFFGAVGRFCVMFFASSAIGVLLGLISALVGNQVNKVTWHSESSH